MNNDVNRQFRLKSRPVGRIKDSDFEYVESPIPLPQDGEAVVRSLYLSLDPTHRVWMSDMDQYMPPVEIGAVMRGGCIGQVVASRSQRYQVGDLVAGFINWQDYSVARQEDVMPLRTLPKSLPIPLPTMMAACGMTGLTAYFGLLARQAETGRHGRRVGSGGRRRLRRGANRQDQGLPHGRDRRWFRQVQADQERVRVAMTRQSTTRRPTGASSWSRPHPRASTSTSRTWAATSWRPSWRE